MILHRHNLPAVLVALAALMVVVETICFARLQPGYSHIAHTISELGATGSLHPQWVSFGFFLPVGLLVWLALWLVHMDVPGLEVSITLAFLSCLGTGYALSAFFPCDPGAPLFGTWRTLVHNVLGFVDYEGTGIGFLLAARLFARRDAAMLSIGFLFAGVMVLVGLALLSTQAAFHLRGAIQRITEVIQFTGVSFACALLPQRSLQFRQALFA
jgi:hypothetical protein